MPATIGEKPVRLVDDSMPTWRRMALDQARLGRLCPVCLGLGVAREGDYPPGHPAFGVLSPCPRCGKVRR